MLMDLKCEHYDLMCLTILYVSTNNKYGVAV